MPMTSVPSGWSSVGTAAGAVGPQAAITRARLSKAPQINVFFISFSPFFDWFNDSINGQFPARAWGVAPLKGEIVKLLDESNVGSPFIIKPNEDRLTSLGGKESGKTVPTGQMTGLHPIKRGFLTLKLSEVTSIRKESRAIPS